MAEAVIVSEHRRLLRLGGSPGAGPGLWGAAAAAQWARVALAAEAIVDGVPDNAAEVACRHDALGYECHFLLVAIRNVRAHCRAVLSATGDVRVRDALAAFDAAAPAARALRDYATHLDEYLLGRGHDATIPEGAWLQTVIVSPETEVSLTFGATQLRLGEAAQAAGALADAVEPVWWERVEQLREQGR